MKEIHRPKTGATYEKYYEVARVSGTVGTPD
jgi:hypothetical protein